MARQMKDSGIEWIGEIPKEWELLRMKSCIQSLLGGHWGENASGNEGDVICLRIADFDYNHFMFKETPIEQLTIRNYDNEIINKLALKNGDILIEKSGGGEKTPVGRTVIFNKDYRALYANFMERLRCNSFIYPNYMQYIFVTFYKKNYTRNYIKQTTGIQNLDLTSMLAQELVAVPELKEQQRIADFLDQKCAQIDEIMQKTHDTIAEYKKLKQSVITQAVTKGVRGERPMKDSGIEWIGEIPEEWEISKIKYGIIKVGSGKTPLGGAETYIDNGILFLRSQNIYNTGLVFNSVTYISEETDEEMKNTRVLPNDVLLNITGGSIGRCCLFPKELHSANVNQHVSIIRVNNDIFSAEYIHYYWMSYIGQTIIDLYQTGGNREGFSAEAIKQSVALFLSVSEQQEIAAYLDQKCSEIDKLIEKKEQLVSELESYKKSLIYEYVTGKKEVVI